MIKIGRKFIIIFALALLVAVVASFGLLRLSSLLKEGKQVLNDIEYVYYYLKKEPTDLRLFGTIRKDDGVSRSVWENYLSTSDEEIKKISKLIEEDKSDIKKISKFREMKIFDNLKVALGKFSLIRDEAQKRIENISSFSESKLKNLEKELQDILDKVREEAKNFDLDLR